MVVIGSSLVRDSVYWGVAGACAEQEANSGSAPLAVTISGENSDINIVAPPGVPGPHLSNPGEVTATANPTGGTSPYTYAWTITEVVDPDGVFAVNNNGTTTTQTYNDATMETTFTQPPPPAPPNPPPIVATYRVACTVTDSATNTASANYEFNLLAN